MLEGQPELFPEPDATASWVPARRPPPGHKSPGRGPRLDGPRQAGAPVRSLSSTSRRSWWPNFQRFTPSHRRPSSSPL